MNILISWLVNAVGVVLAAFLLPFVSVDSFWTAMVVAVVLAVVNVLIKPLILLLTLPLNILTLGLFTFVIDAGIIMLTDSMIDGFAVGGFVSALIFSLILGLINGLLGKMED